MAQLDKTSMGNSDESPETQPSEVIPRMSRRSNLGNSSTRMVSGLKVGNLLKTWETVSKINFLNMSPMAEEESQDSDKPKEPRQSLRRRSIGLPPKNLSLQRYVQKDMRDLGNQDLFAEHFPVNVTSLMNEDQLWGCYYTFPELYGDEYSPVVHVRDIREVPDLVGGVLTREMIAVYLTYLRRTPIQGDFVFIKLDVSNKHLINIDVLHHYKYLVYLDLSSNNLTNLSVLSHLLYLQYLAVNFNRLSTVLEYDVPQWFLTEVHYKFNSVKKIRDLTMFWSITVLDLSHNNIKCISGLENMYYLRRLDLSFNHIQRLENLNNLRLIWLDVSYNNISSFEFSADCGLWTLLHLEYLNINENNLTSMKIFSGCTRLQELHCRNNRLLMLMELAVYMRQMRRLTILDLRANPVCDTPGYKKVTVTTFPRLLHLDGEDLDAVEQRLLKTSVMPDVGAFSCHRLLRLLYIEQLSRARVSPFVPPADTTEVPLVIFVGYEGVGKGSLARRLAKECKNHIELAIQTTTALQHSRKYYHVVTRKQFDDMILAGEFLTYTEMDGESYGLSREESFIKDGKVKLACMDLTSALMMVKRGRRPFLILATCQDKAAMKQRQKDRKDLRNRKLEQRTSIDVPIEKSTLQIVVSSRILVTGILNEILLTLPEEKVQNEFILESECTLLMDSAIRKAMNTNNEIKMLTYTSSSATSIENASQVVNQKIETSLYSLYKGQGTDEYASDNGSKRDQDRRSSRHPQQDKLSEISRNKGSRVVFSSANSAKSSKSVTFTSQEDETNEGGRSNLRENTFQDNLARNLTGMIIEETRNDYLDPKAVARSMSKGFPWETEGVMQAKAASRGSIEDSDLWLTFLVETGLLQSSDPDLEVPSEVHNRHETKLDDPDFILKLLAIYRSGPGLTTRCTCNSSVNMDDYEDIHRRNPGLFWDCITMDDPEAAFRKAKKIIKDIVQSQSNIKPMFDIDFIESISDHPIVIQKMKAAANKIVPRRFFF